MLEKGLLFIYFYRKVWLERVCLVGCEKKLVWDGVWGVDAELGGSCAAVGGGGAGCVKGAGREG